MTALSTPQERATNPLDIMEQIVTANDWAFDRRSESEMAAEAPGKWCDYGLYFSWSHEISAMHFTCAFDLKVPETPSRGALRASGARERAALDRPFRHGQRRRHAGVPPLRPSARRSRRLRREPGGHGRHRHHGVRAVLSRLPVRALGRQDAGRSVAGRHAGVRRARRERAAHATPKPARSADSAGRLRPDGRGHARRLARARFGGVGGRRSRSRGGQPGRARSAGGGRRCGDTGRLRPGSGRAGGEAAKRRRRRCRSMPDSLAAPCSSRSWRAERSAGCAQLLGAAAAIVRAMPNTPAAVRQGSRLPRAGEGVTAAQRDLCDDLLQAVGAVAWVEDEGLLDPVTAVSGGGPAYVFLLVEVLETGRRSNRAFLPS